MQTPKEVTYDPTNPYPWYRYMRATQPVYYDEQMTDRTMMEIENLTLITEFPAQNELAGYLLPLIEHRRREPANDLISSLIQAEVDGEKLSTYDIQATCVLVLLAGYETTTTLI